MYVLYGGRYTRALIVEMVLLEGQIPYALREVDILTNEHRSPEYLAINPSGLVPALVCPQGETLFETPAIALYLAEQHALEWLAPAVSDAARGPFLSGLFMLTDELEPTMKRFFYPHRYVVRKQDTQAIQRQALATVVAQLRLFEQRLQAGGPYYLGERFSLVDLVLSFWATYVEPFDVMADCPAVSACLNNVRTRERLREPFTRLTGWRDEYVAEVKRGGSP